MGGISTQLPVHLDIFPSSKAGGVQRRSILVFMSEDRGLKNLGFCVQSPSQTIKESRIFQDGSLILLFMPSNDVPLNYMHLLP